MTNAIIPNDIINPSAELANYKLVWNDEFNDPSIDKKKWNIDTNARKDAINTESAVKVENGMLIITTYTESGVHYTGFLHSQGKFEKSNFFMKNRNTIIFITH